MTKPYWKIETKYNHNRNYKTPLFMGKGDGKIYTSRRLCGVEFEVSLRNYSIATGNSWRPIPENIDIISEPFYDTLDKMKNILYKEDADGIEIITPPLSGKKFEDQVFELCDLFKKNNLVGSRNCGAHIHVDLNKGYSHYNKRIHLKRLVALLDTYMSLEKWFVSTLPMWRRKRHWCQSIFRPISNLKQFNSTKDIIKKSFFNTSGNKKDEIHKIKYGKDCGININYVLKAGNKHIEIRYLEGTTDPINMITWASFHTTLIDKVLELYESNPNKLDTINKKILGIVDWDNKDIYKLSNSRFNKISSIVRNEFGIHPSVIKHFTQRHKRFIN